MEMSLLSLPRDPFQLVSSLSSSQFKGEGKWPQQVKDMIQYEAVERGVMGEVVNEVITCGIVKLQEKMGKVEKEQVRPGAKRRSNPSTAHLEQVTTSTASLTPIVRARPSQLKVDLEYFLNLVLAVTDWAPVGVEVLAYEVWLLGVEMEMLGEEMRQGGVRGKVSGVIGKVRGIGDYDGL